MPTKLNLADLASRGMKMGKKEQGKQDMQFWLNGPEFLWKEHQSWPEQPIDQPDVEDMDPEVKRIKADVRAVHASVVPVPECLIRLYPSAVLLVSIAKVRTMAIEIQAIYIIPLWTGSRSVRTRCPVEVKQIA